jgi:ABC-type antimicrobial peptide transport system permease subunit
VAALIAERLPATLELVLIATLISLGVGIPLGVVCALRPNGLLSRLIQTVSLVGISTPTFVTGIVLILIFAVTLKVLPSFGRGEVVQLGWWSTGLLTGSGWRSLVLPAITLSLYQLTLIMRLVRSEMIDVLSSDFIRYARARGLPSSYIHYRLALKNALMPVITVTGLQIGSLIAFYCWLRCSQATIAAARGAGPIEALKGSLSMTKGVVLRVFFWSSVWTLIGLVLALALGTLLSLPIGLLAGPLGATESTAKIVIAALSVALAAPVPLGIMITLFDRLKEPR